MATNVKYKRSAIALMRDGIKSQYKKSGHCAVCDTVEDLELHHYHTVSHLVKNFARENRLDFNDETTVLNNRTAFYDKHMHELVEDTVTLCHNHHVALHRVYGTEPALSSAKKQKNWVIKQRDKFFDITTPTTPADKPTSKKKSGFGKFL